ncbi:formate--tetrahydrofolate ligase [Micrococcoides hystricis]|uniref:Formate--tetrahydrofolate ligase n=1 Tax=Micrococcoides hystricis TaxID=1572761 RepID=A0ABV6PBL1_9MICC
MCNMEEMSDLSIAQAATLKPIREVAAEAEINPEALLQFGDYKAKIDPALLDAPAEGQGKVVLVTGISPTPAGEGKSTVTVGLSDALRLAGEKVMIALREPSLGPIFGIKGGATGGGYSQVLPMEDINMHFTGDFHAITSANNLLVALIDNHIHQGNELNIDPRRIVFRRVLDMNDRSLRSIVSGLGGPTEGVPREAGFDITVASEIMAIFCLAKDIQDLQDRIDNIVFGFTYDRKPVTVKELGGGGAMTMLLKEALKPNLVQTIAGTPALVHGGPFANIAHGCNSLIATQTARRLADIVVTEAGFGADLGAEKFMDIKARAGGFAPDAVVIVATIRALKMHGGLAKDKLKDELDTETSISYLSEGVKNLERHIDNVRGFGVTPVVAINKFTNDSDDELNWLKAWLEERGVKAAVADIWAKGGAGGQELAEAVLNTLDEGNNFKPLYELEDTVAEKVEKIVTTIYRGDGVEFTAAAKRQLKTIAENGWDDLPVCMAKTQYSFSDDAALLGAPDGFTITVRELIPKTGAGFVVALTGAVMTMPGLPKVPAAMKMGVDEDGHAVGLF